MQIHSDSVFFSASDLSNYLGCRHLTFLDRCVAAGELEAPAWRDPGLVQLQRRGLDHEQAFVDHLLGQGLELVDLRPTVDSRDAAERTLEAMASGADAIVQGALRRRPWGGRVDILRRVEAASGLGPWSYEVVDTKLARQTRAGTVLQLALYSQLLGHHLGSPPQHMHVVKPGPDFPQETFRWHDIAAYFRRLQREFEHHVRDNSEPPTYPLPVPQCDLCRWWRRCDRQRHSDDHLSLVAGMRNLHIAELEGLGIRRLEDFANRPVPFEIQPEQGSPDTYQRLHHQARAQLQGRLLGEPFYQLRPNEPSRGLARLPAPSPGDIFFDFEADPFVDEGGLEYLFGYAMVGEDGEPSYHSHWALNREEERQAFESFVDFLSARLATHPDFHVYHFSPYEPSALKRLMGRYLSREDDIDHLLRSERFVDLLAVTRQGLWVGVERYSLKELEPFYGFQRRLDLPTAQASMRQIDTALEMGTPELISRQDRQRVEAYNRDDCLSTAALRDWLEARRQELLDRGHAVPRPEIPSGEASDALQAQQSEVQEVFDALTTGITSDPAAHSDEDQARLLLAHLLDYFRRELKSAYWEVFRLRDLDEEQLLDERKAISELTFVEVVAGTSGRLPVHRYSYPEQETAVRLGDQICASRDAAAMGSIEAIDRADRKVDIRKRGDSVDRHPRAVFVKDSPPTKPLDTSLLAFARTVVEHGIDGQGPHRALRDLLLRRPPRLATVASGALTSPNKSILESAKGLALDLDRGVLPIQGPPGTGKTYIGARLIVELMRHGRRVGVTAVSHKVIRNLLEKTLEAARQEGLELEVAHKPSSRKAKPSVDGLPDGYHEVKGNDQILAWVGQRVVGGTAWLWARDSAEETLDVLVVDEAGQMSLAQVLAAGRSARSLILLGDPQQLEQPQRGSHPEGADRAALEHLLDGRPTLPAERGLFLDTTWRLSAEISALTSELYYEDRLRSHPSLEQQRVLAAAPFDGNGLYYLPVSHHGNQATSPEEVELVVGLVDHLLQDAGRWLDREGTSHALTPQDILIVAPFNAHVGALASRLSDGLRVGTVDRFQGQEAPIVIYSLASSSVEEAPRGMAFLLNPNRLNVATSRARCQVLLVASPRLFEAECRTPEMMRWANGLCRFRELAHEVRLPGGVTD